MEKIAIMHPYFLPYMGYFQLINEVDKFVFYDTVNYKKRGWINRNRMKNEILFTIPIKKQSSNRLIKDTEFIFDSRSKRKFLSTIGRNYSNSPNFAEVNDLIRSI